ncbi:MAG: hypothetical protein NTZ80_04415 [Patescibacteria group bacterium]|nr:hypothetical protein [Patescibacteria group bacterium]
MPLLKIIDRKGLKKINSCPVSLERDIQNLIEDNLPETLDIDFVYSEYSIQGGRMDTLGLDQGGNPVIIEYKKGGNASVISQAAFYYTWLLDHQADFEKMVSKAGLDRQVRWDSPRLICMAEEFNFYDYSAIKVLKVRVELLKYRFYGDDLVYITPDRPIDIEERLTGKAIATPKSKMPESILSLDEFLAQITDKDKRKLFEDAREAIMTISGNIQEKINRTGVSFRTSVLFADVYPINHKHIVVYFPNKLLSPEIIAKCQLKQGKSQTTIEIKEDKDIARLEEAAKFAYEASM